MTLNDDELRRRQLKGLDDAKFEQRAARAARTQVHGIIPQHFFSAPSSECRQLFIDGHYYGAISLAQAVAEGLVRYLGDFHSVGARKDPPLRARRLCNEGVISKSSLEAFLLIWGNDRNTFHHLNNDIPANDEALEQRAQACVASLYVIESEIFAFEIIDGKIAPKNPAYWPQESAEYAVVNLRLGIK